MYGNASSRESAAKIREKIEAIPKAMRRMSWSVSAALMERWLRSPAWRMPEAWKGKHAPDPRSMALPHLDQNIVRMNWVMRHPRARAAMDELRANMANESARQQLRGLLTDVSWGVNDRVPFGSRELSAIWLDKVCHSNSRPLGGKLDRMDDMQGGLGAATLKVALIGEASRERRSDRTLLQVTDAGFYIRDTYDFNGPQYLGTWTRNRVWGKGGFLLNALSDGLTFRWGKPTGHLENSDFEAYRRATGFGGDFIIYSDVHWEPVNLLLDLT